MPGTRIDKIFPSKKEEIEFRLKVIEECIEYLDAIGYYGAALLLRKDLIEHKSKENDDG